jgi:hypothetical protein
VGQAQRDVSQESHQGGGQRILAVYREDYRRVKVRRLQLADHLSIRCAIWAYS